MHDEDAVAKVQREIHDYLQAASIMNKAIADKEKVSSELIRAVAQRAAKVFRAYCSPGNWPHWDGGENMGMPAVPLPVELADEVFRAVQSLVYGHIPQWMLHLQRRGAPQNDVGVQQDIGIALAYKRLCELGRLDNKKPVKTISDAFGVSARAVQQWAKQYSSEPSRWFPAAKTEDERAQLIADKFPIAATRYKEWGRGTKNDRPFGKAQRRTRAK